MLDQVEERIIELENREVEFIFSSEEQNENRMKESEDCFRDTIEETNMYITCV